MAETTTALASASVDALASVENDTRANPVDVYLASFAADTSRRTMADALKRILRVLKRDPEAWREAPWWDVRYEIAVLIRARLVQQYGPATARLALSALRGVLKTCWTLGYLDAEALARATSWKPVQGSAADVGRELTAEEIGRLRATCERAQAFTGALDGAILACGFSGGLRRFELAALRVGDVSDDCHYLLVRGKGNKEKRQKLNDWAACAVEAWLAQRALFPFTTESLFVRVARGKALDAGLSKWQVWRRLHEVGKRAGVAFTPHDMRRTYGSALMRKHDLRTVQRLMRHSDPRTTARYDRRPQEEAEAALSTLEAWGNAPKETGK